MDCTAKLCGDMLYSFALSCMLSFIASLYAEEQAAGACRLVEAVRGIVLRADNGLPLSRREGHAGNKAQAAARVDQQLVLGEEIRFATVEAADGEPHLGQIAGQGEALAEDGNVVVHTGRQDVEGGIGPFAGLDLRRDFVRTGGIGLQSAGIVDDGNMCRVLVQQGRRPQVGDQRVARGIELFRGVAERAADGQFRASQPKVNVHAVGRGVVDGCGDQAVDAEERLTAVIAAVADHAVDKLFEVDRLPFNDAPAQGADPREIALGEADMYVGHLVGNGGVRLFLVHSLQSLGFTISQN